MGTKDFAPLRETAIRLIQKNGSKFTLVTDKVDSGANEPWLEPSVTQSSVIDIDGVLVDLEVGNLNTAVKDTDLRVLLATTTTIPEPGFSQFDKLIDQLNGITYQIVQYKEVKPDSSLVILYDVVIRR